MLHLGILKTLDSQTHTAGVQLAGSLTTYLDDIPVATNIAPEAMTVGNYVLVAIPGGNPRDACIVASWPAGSSGIRDHGDLDGLADDDHAQYLNVARHDLTARHPLANLDPLVCSEDEADSKITTHKNDASAHHTKTASSEIDHGSIQGLGDDDHSQYLNVARHDLTARHPLGTVVPHESALNNLGDVDVPSPSDDDVIYWDNAASKWKCKQPSGGGGGTKIQDADSDTYLWVEKTADEDKIHGVVKGVEAFLLDDVGILSLVKQSAAKAHMSANQGIPQSQGMTLCTLNVEDYDVQGEFNTSTYRFTASKAGRYLAVGIVCYYYGGTTTGHHHEGVIRKNNVNTIMGAADSSVNGQSQFIHMIGIVDLAVNDYLTLHTKHDYSSTKYIEKNQTTLMVMKMS